MKVTDLRRKLRAALAAGGLLAPGFAHAADLNTNLVLNPGFENVDINTEVQVAGSNPATFAVKINDWGGTKMGFAYSHNGMMTGTGGPIRDYANGGPLAGGGNFYFTSNATPAPSPDITGPGQFSQDIDVSTGASGNLIASGNAAYKVGAFFSSFSTDGDFGNIHLDFLNSSGSSLGTAVVSDNDPSTWTQNFRGGPIPAGTAKVKLSVYGTALAGGPDGYIDNVDFQVTNEVIQPVLQINVNRDTGAISLLNQTGGPASFKSYSITSAYGSLQPSSWLSIADNYDAGSPGANQVDPAHNWSELTDTAAHGDLSEADLQAAVGATISHTRTINLGNAWLKAPTEDLVFRYISGSQVVQGIVNYTGHSGSAFANGDFNFDSAINSADWMIFRANQHADFAGKSGAEAYQMGDISGDFQNNHTDFVIFKTLYDAANGAGAFVAMVAAVPEPSAVVLVLTSGLFTLPLRRRVSDGG
jgi:hypothetical protein